MNEKWTVKDASGRLRFCVLDATTDAAEQLAAVLDIKPGYGRAVRADDAQICIVDYYTNETIGSFDIVRVEQTDLPLSLRWSLVE